MPFFHRPGFAVACLLLSFPLLLLPRPACAAGPGFDAFFGYSRLGSQTFYASAGGLNGWQAGLHVKLVPFLGGEADVAHYGLGAGSLVPRTTTVLVGPRVTVGAAGIHVFAHGLLGGEHSANNSSTMHVSGGALAFGFGGGADFRIAPFLAWRVAADYLQAPTQSPSGASHDRFTTGIVFRF